MFNNRNYLPRNDLMKIMAIDLGSVRTGIAICDKLEMLASPVCVLKIKDKNLLFKKIVDMVLEYNVECLVLGYPRNMNSTIGERARKSEQFAELLKVKLDISIILWDERNTTVLANRLLDASEVFGAKRKNVVDTVAAVLILENYIRFRKNKESEYS